MIQKIDHVVITTADASACLDFYRACGFTVRDVGGRFELFAGDFKMNVHLLGRELSPHAAAVQPGSADLCFQVAAPLEGFARKLVANGLEIALGPVARTGARGPMQSVYLRDPDGNLIEFSVYE